MAGQVGGGIEIMASKTKSGSQNDLIEHRGTAVDEDLAPACGADDAPDITRIYVPHVDGRTLTEKPSSPRGIPVTAGHLMSHPLQLSDKQ
jgi:hypothetical protein